MPPVRSIGRPAPAGLAARGTGSGLAAGVQAGVGMLMSSPTCGSSGPGASVASSGPSARCGVRREVGGRRLRRPGWSRRWQRASRSRATDWSRGAFGPVLDDLGEVAPLGVAQRCDHPIVDGEQVELGEASQEPGVEPPRVGEVDGLKRRRMAQLVGAEPPRVCRSRGRRESRILRGSPQCGGTGDESCDRRSGLRSSPRSRGLTHGYYATALWVTPRPPRGSDGSYGPCGPAWTGRPGRPRRLAGRSGRPGAADRSRRPGVAVGIDHGIVVVDLYTPFLRGSVFGVAKGPVLSVA